MLDKLKEIPGKILEWWNRFTNKQKTIIVAMVAAVVFTFAIIVYVFSRPQYVRLDTYETSQEASKVIDILKAAGITYKESPDLLTIDVESSQLAQANYALAAGGYTPGDLAYDDVVKVGMSTTSADRENMVTVFLQKQIEDALKTVNQVRDATVIINRPPQLGTLAAQNQETSASVQLVLDSNSTFTATHAATMARSVANMLGCSTTANITIWDQDANILFAGGDDYSAAGMASSLQELQDQMEAMKSNQVRQVLYGTKQYDMISVASHLNIDFASYEETRKEYYANDDRTEGMLAQRDKFSSESINGIAGSPGTDSNGGDLTGYVAPDYSTSQATQDETSEKFLPNEWSQYIQKTAGAFVDYSTSSMAISLITYREYYEDRVRRQGLLDGSTTWEDFKEEHRQNVRTEVPREYYEMAANATGISADRITIIAYESPIFYDKEGVNISGTDVLSIVMIVLILALLGFVILRSMVSRKAASEEEELSVESMLQSNPEVIDDIDVETKSEVRLMIEKFVDENPEAAANLLRNWLNEDWN